MQVNTRILNENFFLGKIGVPILGALNLIKTPKEGAQTILHCAVAPRGEIEMYAGRYFVECTPAVASPLAHDKEIQKEMMDLTQKIIASIQFK